MKIGYLTYASDISIRKYIENVVREMSALGAELIPFGFNDPLPETADVYWDPRLTGARTPTEKFLGTSKPCVATLHGIGELSLPPWELFSNVSLAIRVQAKSIFNIARWHRRWKHKCTAIITVSNFDKKNIERKFLFRSENLVPIHLGVDHAIFHPPSASKKQGERYFLHVSAYKPNKNVDRVIAAYQALDPASRPGLMLIVPGYPRELSIPGLKMIRTPMSHEDLSVLYQNALGFVFPSLHEGFGLPIVEAMACGCPVITSNVSACPEIAGDAALLVNPRSVKQISRAMQRLADEPELVSSLREKGIERAKAFTWQECAKGHLKVFEMAVARS